MAPSTPPWHISYCEWPYLRLWDSNFQEGEGGSDNVPTFKFSRLRNIQNFWTLLSFSFFSMVTLVPNPALIPSSPILYLLIQLEVMIHVHIFKRETYTVKKIKDTRIGFPWWCSGWEPTCQCREHGFEPLFRKIPHATEQLRPCATTTEPACPNCWSLRA